MMPNLWQRVRLAWRAITLSDFPAIAEVLNAGGGSAGPAVTSSSALGLSAVWKAVVLLSSQVAQLPLIPYRRTDQGPERATDSRLWRILHDEPNDYTGAFTLRERIMKDALLTKGGFAEVERDGAGRAAALHWMDTTTVQVEVEPSGRPRFTVNGRTPMDAADVLWIQPPLGVPPITAARLSLSLGMAREQHAASFFRNGAWPGVVLEVKGSLSDPAKKRLIEGVNDYLSGPDKHYKTLVTEDETKVHQFAMSMKDAQWLEGQSFGVEEVARWFNVPPSKLGHKMGERPGGNLEASQLEFLSDSLSPWLIRFEQEFERKLIGRELRSTMYLEHLVDALLRTDSETRHRIITESVGGPYRSLNEGRRLENLPAKDGGDEIAPPAAAAAPAPAGDEPRSTPGHGVEVSRAKLVALAALAESVAARFVRRELADAGRAARKPEVFGEWVEANEDRDLEALVEYLAPVVRVWLAETGGGDAEAVARDLARAHLAKTREDLGALPAGSALAPALAARAQAWAGDRPRDLVDAILASGRQT